MNQDSENYQSRMAWALGGAAIGALAMYLAETDRGRQTRELATDKMRSAAARTSEFIDDTSRDLGSRMEDLRAQAGRLLSSRRESALGERVPTASRSQEISRAMSQPGGIALALLAAGGVALLSRNMTGMRGGQQTIDLHKTIYINARPEQVFDLWSSYENFPRFMSHVQEVRDLGGGRSHWIVSGLAGIPVEWDANTTQSKRPEVLAWRSDSDATVQNEGTIRFEPEGSGTRVTVQLSYSPPGGVIGHMIASLFGQDAKQQMDDDLARMKSFIETSKFPSDAAQPVQQPTTPLH